VLVDLRNQLDLPIDVMGEQAPLFGAMTGLKPQSFTDGLDTESIREGFHELADTLCGLCDDPGQSSVVPDSDLRK